MWSNVRQRETIIGQLIFENHPILKIDQDKYWYHNGYPHSLEGGDIVILSEKVLAIGIS